MAVKSPAERLNELEQVGATVKLRLENNERNIEKLTSKVDDYCPKCDQIISHLKRDIEALEKWKKEQEEEAKERKKWYRSFGPNIVGALVSGSIAALVALYVARKTMAE